MKNFNRILSLLFFGLLGSSIQAQIDTTCHLTCNDRVHISLDSACQFTVQPLDVLSSQDTAADCGGVEILITYPIGNYGDLYPNGLDGRLRGQEVRYSVRDTLTGNSCWGYLLVEDKQAPALDCTNDTIFCFDPVPPPVTQLFDCGYPVDVEIRREQWTPFDCAADSTLLGVLEREIRVADKWGNLNECTQLIYFIRLSLDSLQCIEEKEFDCLNPDLWDEDLVEIDEEGRAIPLPLVEDGMNIGLVEPPFVLENGDTTYLWPNNASCSIFTYYKDHVLQTCGSSYKIRRTWTIKDWCDSTEQMCVQWIPVHDTVPPFPEYTEEFPPFVLANTKSHDCKTLLHLAWPPIRQECSLKSGVDTMTALSRLKVRYELEYKDPTTEDERIVYKNGEIPYGETVQVYLPPTGFMETIPIRYTITDECWNDTSITQLVMVYDNDPPTPVCDEITQVTLDPDSCWARVYAKDLDDGSHDNCSDSLHFAVASMQDINYWTEYWIDSLVDCVGHDYYYRYQHYYEDVINEWLDFYLFDDYVDVRDCTRDTLVMRVYQQFNFPPYDPHLFKGSEHYWYNWNRGRILLRRSFRCNYLLYYDKVAHHERFYPPLTCEDVDFFDEWENDSDMSGSNEFRAIGIGKSSDDIILPNGCYDDDQEKQLKIQQNLLDYPLLQAFIDHTLPYRFAIENEGIRRLFYKHPYYSDCMIDIIKDDKQPPVCDAPADYTIYCDSVPYEFEFGKYGFVRHASRSYKVCEEEMARCHYDPNYLDGGLEVENDWSRALCQLWLDLDTFDQEDGRKPIHEFGEVNYYDNCTPYEDLLVEYEDEIQLDECMTGYKARTWTITDGCGNTNTCFQKVIILPRSDFEVIFPEDIKVDCAEGSFDLSPEGLGGTPIVSDDDCEMVGTSYEDQVFEVVEDACYKIVRTWKLANWCVYSPEVYGDHEPDIVIDTFLVAGERRPCTFRHLKDNGDGIIEYTQIIKVNDYIKPVLNCKDTVVCSYDPDCMTSDMNIVLGDATDNCTPTESISYLHYLIPEGASSSSEYIYGHGNVLTGSYDLGTYEVHLIAKDRCGNEDTCVFELFLIDCKKPTPYCFNGIATVIMPMSGEVTIWASDLDAGSFDNCPGELSFSFDEDGEETARSFECTDIPDGKEEIVTVQIFVTDVYGNSDFCTTYIALQDGSGNACEDKDITEAQIIGSIYTESNVRLPNVEITLGNEKIDMAAKTMGDGSYVFADVPMNDDYRLRPYYNHEIDNGVSTLDLVMIQKHVLGIQKIESPYRLIAADLNLSNSITALDIIALRRIVLKMDQVMPNGNTSWRFVDALHEFEDPTSPWDFPQEIAIDYLDATIKDMDFIGVKVGDINGSAKVNARQVEAEIRSDHSLTFRVEDAEYQAGELIEVPLYAEDFKQIEGMQFNLEHTGLRVVEIDWHTLDESQAQWVAQKDNLLAVSWNEYPARMIEPTQQVATIHFEAIETGRLSQALSIKHERMYSEAYHEEKGIISLQLDFQQAVHSDEFTDMYVSQNAPNPFSTESQINIYLSKPSSADLVIQNIKGEVVWQSQKILPAGNSIWTIKGSNLPASGIYYYQIRTAESTHHRKMIKIN